MKIIDPSLLDLFGSRPGLKIQGADKTWSLVGLISTLAVGAFAIWALVFTGLELFHKRNPALTTAQLQGATRNEIFSISEDTWDMAFGLVDLMTGSFYNDESIFTIHAWLFPNSGNYTFSYQLDLEICPESKNFDTQYDFKGNIWCFKKDQSKIKEITFQTRGDSFVLITFGK